MIFISFGAAPANTTRKRKRKRNTKKELCQQSRSAFKRGCIQRSPKTVVTRSHMFYIYIYTRIFFQYFFLNQHCRDSKIILTKSNNCRLKISILKSSAIIFDSIWITDRERSNNDPVWNELTFHENSSTHTHTYTLTLGRCDIHRYLHWICK